MRRLLGVVVVLLVTFALDASPARAGEQDLRIESFTVDATVNADGTMDVVETLEFVFEAEFNGGTRSIPPASFGQSYEVIDVEVTENGERRDLDNSNPASLRWFGSADHSKVTGRHTYELTYRVLRAVDVFPDVGVLFWKFVGSDFPQLDEVTVDVTFPGDGFDLRVFPHGALHGVAGIDGNVVSLRVADNPAGQFVEARITYPARNFTVPPSGSPVLQQVLAEEGALAEAANRQRALALDQFELRFSDTILDGLPSACDDPDGELVDPCERLDSLIDQGEPRIGRELTIEDGDLLLAIEDARAEIERELDRRDKKRNKAIGNVVGPIVAVGGALAFFLLWQKFGKEPDHPTDIGPYWREVPAETPAVVAAIDDWGTVDSKAFAATLIDLAQKGWLTISEEPGRGGPDFRFTRSQQTEGELRDYENSVLWRLFQGRPSVTQDELVSEAKLDRASSASWMSTFKAAVKRDYDAQAYESKRGCLPWALHALLIVVVGGIGLLVTAGLLAPLGVAAIVVAVALVLMTPLLRQRTEKGARKMAEVEGLRRFLKDFSLVDSVPVGHLVLYERYLVYAVALGVAEDLLNGLRVRFPDLVNPNSGFATWYAPAYVVHGGGGFDRLASLSSIGSFANDLTSQTSAAFSVPSSSSGGGGGFSGGGGGGGGGGGAGGW